MRPIRVIVSGGGTGGHIFPAVSIANAVRESHPDAEILFVGAEGRMEMQRVPEAGYKIYGLPIAGFDRKNLLKNIIVLQKILKSRSKAKKIIKQFQPDVVVGVGGYASGPTLQVAASMGIPTLLQEQNSYAGVTNKILAKHAKRICVAYDGMERFFPADKIIKTGNPVRQSLVANHLSKEESRELLGIKPDIKTILIIGGSLGARTINESVLSHLQEIAQSPVQIVWQTGKFYSKEIQERLSEVGCPANLYVRDFISNMDNAYAAADIVISRAGASSISELCLLGKPCILVPSPNVAEDHQTKNAEALSTKGAALLVKDVNAREELIPLTLTVVADDAQLQTLHENILKLALRDSAKIIAEEVYKLGMGLSQETSDEKKEAETPQNIYFVGAGGIGMSALVRYFLNKKCNVGGYDKTPTPLTKQLITEGAQIHYDDDVNQIPICFKDPATTLVIYTPAIPADHKELTYFRENGFDIQKRAQVLGTLTRQYKGLCVAGTHGKTTTSSMLAHLFHQSHVDCNAFLGGITKNYGTNYILSDKSDFVVIEADEFDRSFHWLRPYMSIITSTDPDHLDIYGTKEAYLESFRHYTSLIQSGGALLLHTGLEVQPDVQDGVTTYTYSRTEGDFHAENIKIGGGEIRFDFITPQGRISDINLGVPVTINIDNSIAAMAVAWLNGLTEEEIREGMRTFGGVDRRFDFKIKNDRIVFLSDYAHHPKEIEQSVKSIKDIYADKKVCAIFQPHLYTRTRDFYKQFADSLSLVDEVVLCDIYPAREAPIPGVTSQLIYDHLREGVEKYLIHKEQVLDFVKDGDFDVLIVLGAGDLDNYTEQITEILKQR